MITRFIRCSVEVIFSVMLTEDNFNNRNFLKTGQAVLANTYAKIYSRGKGWYAVSGYASDGSDVYKVVDAINDLVAHNAVLKEGGYYFDKKGAICGTY